MIRHTVAFKLRHPPGSAPESAFLAAARILSAIPVAVKVSVAIAVAVVAASAVLMARTMRRRKQKAP